MIVRPRLHWFRLLFVWRGSVLPNIVGQLSLVLVVSALSVLCSDWWLDKFPDSALSIPPFTLMGVALAIFLGFRNSVSYERFWEARKQWGAILVAVRAVMRQVMAMFPADAQAAFRNLIARQLAGFAFSLKHQLRQSKAEADLRLYLGEMPAAAMSNLRFQPQAILNLLAVQFAEAQQRGEIGELAWSSLDKGVSALGDAAGACERIAGTPIPYTYRVLMNRTVMVYCLLLPVGLASTIGWLTPLIATFVAYTFLALEMIGEQIEEPFGTEPNDLALDAMCHTIEVSVCELAGLAPLSSAPTVKDYVLT